MSQGARGLTPQRSIQRWQSSEWAPKKESWALLPSSEVKGQRHPVSCQHFHPGLPLLQSCDVSLAMPGLDSSFISY